jgi:hypothetical protein
LSGLPSVEEKPLPISSSVTRVQFGRLSAKVSASLS